MPENKINLTNLDEATFLKRNRISPEDWGKAKIDFKDLLDIGVDHENQTDQLSDTAALFAKIIQRFDGVHSVRWRVKNAEHLMEKIVRKKAKEEAKYTDIDKENYFTKVTDLIGIRALHLFKEDCFIIDEPMRKTWPLEEAPIAYLRDGDQNPITERLKVNGFDIKTHPAGYRSIHYVFSSQPVGRKIITEVQVRTIFEEGWSEIDHNVRYPNFSSNQLVGFFLAIFNRMAGSADEMGAFVRGLIHTLEDNEKELNIAGEEKNKILGEMSSALQHLDGLKKQDEQSQALISELRSKIDQLSQSGGALSHLFSYEKALTDLAPPRGLEQAIKALSKLNELSVARNLGLGDAVATQNSIGTASGLLKSSINKNKKP